MKALITKFSRARASEWAASAIGLSCVVIALSCLALVLSLAFFHGWQKISFDFLLNPSQGDGITGGVWYQIIGTCLLVIGAAVIVTPFAAGVALTAHLSPSKFSRPIIASLYFLNATPSILFGILGFLFFVKTCQWDKSWLSGSLILALMILPTVSLALFERLQTIPAKYQETAQSLGLSDDQLILSIWLPYGIGGLLTGMVMGLARASGETAPIMFTAAVFAGAQWPDGIKDSPVLALPYHIFNLAQDVWGGDALQAAWASALVLLALVLILSLMAAPLRARMHEEAKVG